MKKTIPCIFVLIISFFVSGSAISGDARTWAEIKDGKVWAFHTRSDGKVPVFSEASGLTLVEVTNMHPMPAQKWKYEAKTGLFSEPDPPDPPDPQVEINAKIETEMQSAAGRSAAIERLKRAGGLAADYTEQAISGNVTPWLNGQ